uniref:Uncharacterized protein n=1 Tax=Rhizophora mucronata TaxID=61149 RepID=A0A2P2IUF0_RHIMU
MQFLKLDPQLLLEPLHALQLQLPDPLYQLTSQLQDQQLLPDYYQPLQVHQVQLLLPVSPLR